MDEARPSRRGATPALPDQGEHDFGSSSARFFQPSAKAGAKADASGSAGDRDFGSSADRFFHSHYTGDARDLLAPSTESVDEAEAEAGLDRDFGSSTSALFRSSEQPDEGHRMCGMVANLLKSRGMRKEESADDVCRSVSGTDQTSCNFFVRAFGSDILQKLGEEPIDDICDELDYAKTRPPGCTARATPPSSPTSKPARTPDGDPTRDSAPTANLDEGARVLSVSRARTPWGGSAGLNKGGRSMPVVSSAQQKEVGWDTVDPHNEGHPAASSGRAGLKGLGVNMEGQ
ncbi:uncharacterized protein ACA1_115220 [Acanthamoeba castellanii str. Neff]|uniref:Uncharacterized protein n=1 Tax=Acanthamoeba castellanii (strain ATCC 30010 / Neff) TaxID=1257118 RepID=L8H4J1_ACACF|nr:uncharacterized protein ACA1_115220 [Acanthamoeba castellanii str. Neff]ELR20112.1 hypothetical protein ACA1_115220 [Acanthamoeba castellanii str. Neff]